ncbi:hypothetical protein CEQ48_04275 [Vibrio tarriae]|uniref:Transposase n=1 Tax=Vibrio tarriae TaxID=2014742 RepID=A0AAU8WIT8_9VIBR|nr:hypothetical protein CEQ48_04275 [Vibrio tarriae]
MGKPINGSLSRNRANNDLANNHRARKRLNGQINQGRLWQSNHRAERKLLAASIEKATNAWWLFIIHPYKKAL